MLVTAHLLSALLFVTLRPEANDAAHDLDFWVGNWVMDSSQPEDKATKGAWQSGACTNNVTHEYGGKVIQESFRTEGFTGGSWSMYDSAAKTWKQTWVDDSGAYLLFEGGKVGKEFVLNQTNSKQGKARMRFANFSESGFDWFWEKSKDGKEWILSWHLKYRRA